MLIVSPYNPVPVPLDIEKETKNSAEFDLAPCLRGHRTRTEVTKKKTLNTFLAESDSVVHDPTTLFHKSSQKQRQSEPNTTLPVIQSARNRNLIAPLEIQLVLRDCKEYNKIVKKQVFYSHIRVYYKIYGMENQFIYLTGIPKVLTSVPYLRN